MLQEAIQEIQDKAVKASGTHELPAKSDREERVLLPNGEVLVIEKDHPPRDHVVHDIDSLSAFVADQKDVVVWHDNAFVIAVLNDPTFRDSRVSMPLPIHPTFTALANCAGKDFGQRALIDFLRLNLKKEIDAAVPGFISALRDVKIVQNTSGDANLQHGRESMGKRIEQSVSGVDALPEDFILNVPLWLHLDASVKVECALVIDTASSTFKCGPKPGAIEQAKVQGQKWLGVQLESACDGAVVYFGSPERK